MGGLILLELEKAVRREIELGKEAVHEGEVKEFERKATKIREELLGIGKFLYGKNWSPVKVPENVITAFDSRFGFDDLLEEERALAISAFIEQYSPTSTFYQTRVTEARVEGQREWRETYTEKTTSLSGKLPQLKVYEKAIENLSERGDKEKARGLIGLVHSIALSERKKSSRDGDTKRENIFRRWIELYKPGGKMRELRLEIAKQNFWKKNRE